MSTDKRDYCFCTLALGPQYHTIGSIFLKSYAENIPVDGPSIVVVSDNMTALPDHSKIIKVPLRAGIPGPHIGLKWLAYKEALNLGFETICFIDADSIMNPGFDKSIISNNIEDGFGCNWFKTYEEGCTFGGRGAEKLKALIEPTDQFPIICPVECFMFLHGCRDRSNKFIIEWEKIWNTIIQRGLYTREVCHEIGLATRRTDVNVYKYKSGRNTYLSNFDHFGNPGKKQEMITKYG